MLCNRGTILDGRPKILAIALRTGKVIAEGIFPIGEMMISRSTLGYAFPPGFHPQNELVSIRKLVSSPRISIRKSIAGNFFT